MSKLLFTPTTQEPMANAFLPSFHIPTYCITRNKGGKDRVLLTVLSGKRERARDVKWNLSAGDGRRAGWLLNEKPCRPSLARDGPVAL